MGSGNDPADALFRMIVGQLRDCIKQHGPITKDFIGSATKRLYRQLTAEANNLFICVEEQKIFNAFHRGKREQKRDTVLACIKCNNVANAHAVINQPSVIVIRK